MKEKISVIMPVFNNEKFVAKAIESILNQTYRNFELLIADDGSKDQSKKIIESFNDPRIKTFHNQKNMGALFTWNKLFEMCEGEFITFQDADDSSDVSRLEKQINKFDEINGLGICGTYASYVNESGKYLRTKTLPVTHKEIYETLEQNHQFCGASIMITKKVYQDVGGYPEYFHRIGGEDYYWSAIIAEKYLSYNIPELLYIVTATNDSISRNINNIKQLIVFDIVRNLITDVRKGKLNWIKEDNAAIINEYENRLMEPYLDDQSLIYRKQAFIEARNKNYFKAINFAFNAVLKTPLKLVNHKILVYNLIALLKK
jgi:glycosyltransferase involved in cell wall biosynthesis